MARRRSPRRRGLAELQRLFEAEFERLPPPADDFDAVRWRLMHGLGDVGDAMHDVDAFIEAVALIGWRGANSAVRPSATLKSATRRATPKNGINSWERWPLSILLK